MRRNYFRVGAIAGLGALALLMPAGVAQATLLNGLVAYYPLDGDADDLSVNTNHMAENGAGIGYVGGQVGGAVDLSGTDEWLSVTGTDIFGNTGLAATDSSTTAYSWQAWVNPADDVTSGDDYILSTTNSTLTGQGFALAGRIDQNEDLDVFKQGAAFNSPFFGISNNALPADADGWYHVLTTWDTTNGLTTYINGVSVGGPTGADSVLAQAVDGLNIGADQNIGPGDTIPGRFFEGQIDEVAIWDRVLTTTEIADLYNSGSGTTLVETSVTDGTTFGIDIGPTPTDLWNNITTSNGGVAEGSVIDLDGKTLDGVAITTSNGQFINNGGTDDWVGLADQSGSAPDAFVDSVTTDFAGNFNNLLPYTITITGLSTDLEYVITVVTTGNDFSNTRFDVVTVNGDITYPSSTVGREDANDNGAFHTLTGLSPDGSGTLVIEITETGASNPVVNGVLVTAVLIPEPGTALLAGIGFALMLPRRKRNA